MLRSRADHRPGAVALRAPGRADLTYAALLRRVEEIGSALNTAGLGRGHRIAFVLPNGPEMAVAYLGIAAYAQSAPLNPSYTPSELDFYLSDMRADALVLLEGSSAPARDVARAHGITVIDLIADPSGPAGGFTLRCEPRTDPSPPVSGPALPDETALLLHTSGTTSRPKLVPLTHRNLCVAAGHTRDAFRLGERDLCLNFMPLFHAHGLTSTLLAALSGGGGVVCTPGFSDTDVFGWLAEFRPTWFTGVPTMHQALLAGAGEHGDVLAAADLRFIRSASAPLPAQVLNALEEAFATPVIEAYGMTEAGSLVTSNPLPPGARKTRSVGVPVGGAVAILDGSGRRLGSGESGEIAIRGANVTAGYERNPEANRASFTDGWFRTGDEGYVDGDGYLFIVGRTKEIINRGGSKVSPSEVDEVLSGHPDIASVAAYGVEHPTLGEDVAAAVVLRSGTSPTETEIRAFAAERLADYKVPNRVHFVNEVPKGPTGKIQRLRLAELMAERAAASSGPKPAGPEQERVARLWAQVLGDDGFGIDDNFFDLGGNSLMLARVAAGLSEQTGAEISTVTLTMYPTLRSLASYLAGTGQSSAAPSEAERARHLDQGKNRLLRQRRLTTRQESDRKGTR
ncbi:non-ribosomal peptide synthetase [Nocardiopsis sp. LOL_012]|uniref:non-ribosomal peptide synthetase n=1 Tax=Nocardiopsis sp. LOL_012 TaxID=3345409 RepID=UPI003A887905